MTLRIKTCSSFVLQNTKVSFAYYKCVTSKLFVSLNWKPLIHHFPLALFSRLLMPSIAIMNKNGDKGSAYWKPLSDEKNPFGSLLISTENLNVLMQCSIHLIHLNANPIFFISFRRKFQLKWSYAF